MTNINAARRAFLKRRIGPASVDHHMPWAVAGFLAVCQRCDDCIRVCEPAIVIRGDGGFPTVDFGRGGCTFCGACEHACRYGALDRQQLDRAWRLEAVIGEACLSAHGITCRACGDACDAGAIRFQLQPAGRAVPQLDATRCSGCGGCVAVCPNWVIQIQEAA